METKYDYVPDMASDNAHSRQLRAVPPGSRVLEFGCATGYLSRYMTEELGCLVTGVELDVIAAERARSSCARVVVGDLNDLDLAATLGGERFDVALFGDVLEHLKDPGRVLRAARAHLLPGGRVVATIPNVAHGDVRLALLSGRFEYSRLGLLDDTHLRFFTLTSVRSLFEEAGFTVLSVDRIRVPLFATELAVDPSSYPPEVLAYVGADPEATTYQFVVIAVIADETGPWAALRVELDAALAELAAERARVRALEATLEATRAEGVAQLAAARAEAVTMAAHAEALEENLGRLRRPRWINPLVLADALWRKVRGSSTDGGGR